MTTLQTTLTELIHVSVNARGVATHCDMMHVTMNTINILLFM